MNPELRRNLRLEFSPQRLLALPAVLAVVFSVVWFADWLSHPPTRLYAAAVVMLYAIVLLWGVRKSAGSLARELSNDTWDAQRLSAMSAGELLVGKILGGASYPLYGALLCLCVALVASFLEGFNEDSLLWSTEQLRMELLVHVLRLAFATVVAFFIATVLMMRRMGRTGVSVTLCQVMVIVMIFNLPGPGVFANPENLTEIIDTEGPMVWIAPLIGADTTWYGIEIPGNVFRVLTLSLLVLWSVLWARNALRVELQFRSPRWTLAASMLFFLAFFGGLAYFDVAWLSGTAEEPSIFRKLYPATFAAWVMAGIITYAVIFLAPKSSNEFQRFASCLRTGNLRGALVDLPSWLVAIEITLLVFLAHLILVAVSPSTQENALLSEIFDDFELIKHTPLDMLVPVTSAMLGNIGDWRIPIGLFGFYGLLIRDLALVLLLNLGAKSGRADLAALLYLVVLYAVLPALLYVVDWDSHVAFLWPSVRFGDLDAVAVHWLQAAVMLGLLVWRWRQLDATREPQRA